jgi:hypothetical protein
MGSRKLCLLAKHRAGPLAICIDEQIPTLQSVEPGLIAPPAGDEPDVIGTYQIEGLSVPIYSFATLVLTSRGHSGGSSQ